MSIALTCEMLQIIFASTVHFIHHQGRSGDHLRGSAVLEGTVDTEIRVQKCDKQVSVTCYKPKEAEPFDQFDCRVHPCGNSIVLVPNTSLTNKLEDFATEFDGWTTGTPLRQLLRPGRSLERCQDLAKKCVSQGLLVKGLKGSYQRPGV
jgi:hypothetical protein